MKESQMLSPPIPEIKPNWRRIAAMTGDRRSSDRITLHYLVEMELARRLRDTEKYRRSEVYTSVYNELFARLPDHPQLTRRTQSERRVDVQIERLRRLVPRGASFVEIGAGDAKVSLALCDHCGHCYAVDVSDSVLVDGSKPPNFTFFKIDGIHLPLEDNAIDFIYSNQLVEHLHPDDAADQLKEIVRVLKAGGRYLCLTPNATSGPHDVSKFFDNAPVGFHLKEYSYRELSDLFKANGFRATRIFFGGSRFKHEIPVAMGRAAEATIHLFAKLTGSRGPMLNRYVRGLMGINMIALK